MAEDLVSITYVCVLSVEHERQRMMTPNQKEIKIEAKERSLLDKAGKVKELED